MKLGPLLILVGGGAVAYYLYKNPSGLSSLFGTTPATGTTGTTTGGTTTGGTTTGGTTTGTTPPTLTPGTLAYIFQQIKNNAPAGTQTPDGWSYYLNLFGGGVVAPDPMAVFPSYDRSNPMQLSLADWWAVEAPYLHANAGLSGVLPVGYA